MRQKERKNPGSKCSSRCAIGEFPLDSIDAWMRGQQFCRDYITCSSLARLDFSQTEQIVKFRVLHFLEPTPLFFFIMILGIKRTVGLEEKSRSNRNKTEIIFQIYSVSTKIIINFNLSIDYIKKSQSLQYLASFGYPTTLPPSLSLFCSRLL